MIDFSLAGKIALITGASRGIGEAIAKTLAEYGAHCILVSRKAESLENVADTIVADGGKAEACACHMGYPDQIEGLFETIGKKFGRLDILINNAATNPYFGPMIDAREPAWDKTFEVNLKGPFFMIQHAARLMKASGGGAIVNVSSVNAVTPMTFQGIYAITKAGLVSMTRSYAKELVDDNIRVNALLPGLTATKLAGVLAEDDGVLSTIPMKRAAQPAEMAAAVLYLVSEASSYTTGASIICDGGLTA
ncbi:MAG: SDR family oxidoreductase [Desulfobacterales bacterium]|nr:SDR family oxidoreductase [Desulfobacterales bacterium]